MTGIPDRPRPLSKEELKSIVDNEIWQSMGELSGELTEERSRAMDRYLGEKDGREMEGRSQVNDRSILEVIEWILPSLMRIFATERAVEVDPVGPEDEESAEQETDYLRHLFFKKADGFMLMYVWFKDALLQKTGILKTYMTEEETTERESYENLRDEEFNFLLSDEANELVEYEAVQGAIDIRTKQPTTLHNCVIVHTDQKTKIAHENVPPEEFLISRDARTVYPKDARWQGHYTNPTMSDLVEDGYTWDEISLMELGLRDSEWNEENISRRNLTDEQRWLDTDPVNTMMQTIKFTEGFIRCDMDGDGVAELLKVGRSGDFIEWEEVEDSPFDALTPIPLGHKFHGLSIADLVEEIQDIRTGLLRAYMDNVHQTINGTVYYNNQVNPDDMMTSQPYGNRHVDTEGDVRTSVLHVDPAGLNPAVFSLDEMIDKMLRNRIGDFASQLDPTVLAQANNGVVLEMINEAKAKVEMIARIFAETGVRELFRRIHKLTKTHADDQEEVFKLRNNWIPVHPSSWKDRTDFTVRVGLGTRSKQEAITNIQAIQTTQGKMVELGLLGKTVSPEQIAAAAIEMAELMDEPNGQKFFMPQAPQEQEQPDADMMAVQATQQIEAAKNETKRMELAMKNQQALGTAQIQQMKTRAEGEQASHKLMMENQRLQLDRLKAMTGDDTERQKQAAASAAQEFEGLLAEVRLAMDARDSAQSAMLEKYDIDMKASTEVLKLAAASENEQTADLVTLVGSLYDKIDGLENELNSPKQIERDADGKIVQIGRRKVTYDTDGKMQGIG